MTNSKLNLRMLMKDFLGSEKEHIKLSKKDGKDIIIFEKKNFYIYSDILSGIESRRKEKYNVGDIYLFLCYPKKNYTYSYINSIGYKYISILEKNKIIRTIESNEDSDEIKIDFFIFDKKQDIHLNEYLNIEREPVIDISLFETDEEISFEDIENQEKQNVVKKKDTKKRVANSCDFVFPTKKKERNVKEIKNDNKENIVSFENANKIYNTNKIQNSSIICMENGHIVDYIKGVGVKNKNLCNKKKKYNSIQEHLKFLIYNELSHFDYNEIISLEEYEQDEQENNLFEVLKKECLPITTFMKIDKKGNKEKTDEGFKKYSKCNIIHDYKDYQNLDYLYDTINKDYSERDYVQDYKKKHSYQNTSTKELGLKLELSKKTKVAQQTLRQNEIHLKKKEKETIEVIQKQLKKIREFASRINKCFNYHQPDNEIACISEKLNTMEKVLDIIWKIITKQAEFDRKEKSKKKSENINSIEDQVKHSDTNNVEFKSVEINENKKSIFNYEDIDTFQEKIKKYILESDNITFGTEKESNNLLVLVNMLLHNTYLSSSTSFEILLDLLKEQLYWCHQILKESTQNTELEQSHYEKLENTHNEIRAYLYDLKTFKDCIDYNRELIKSLYIKEIDLKVTNDVLGKSTHDIKKIMNKWKDFPKQDNLKNIYINGIKKSIVIDNNNTMRKPSSSSSKTLKLIDEIHLKYKKRPIIIIPKNNIINKQNVESFFLHNYLKDTEECETNEKIPNINQTSNNRSSADGCVSIIFRMINKDIKFLFIENDKINTFNEIDWKCVVAIILKPNENLKQLNGYPFHSLNDLIQNIQVFVFKYFDEQLSSDLCKKPFTFIDLNKTDKKNNSKAVQTFWHTVEKAILQRRIKLFHFKKRLAF